MKLSFATVFVGQTALLVARTGFQVQAAETVLVLKLTQDDNDHLYYANISIGTPPRYMRVSIQTNTVDSYIVYNPSEICPSQSCSDVGAYSPNISSTYHYLSSNFALDYAEGIFLTGDYISESFTIGNSAGSGLNVGVAYAVGNKQFGALGLGYYDSIGSWLGYPNLLALMVQSELIHNAAYSLQLGNPDFSQGQILIGGVDSSKFIGKLESFSMPLNNSLQYDSISVNLTSFGIADIITLTNETLPMLVDTNATMIYLPYYAVNPLFLLIGLTADGNGYGIGDCSGFQGPFVFTFLLGSTEIIIPIEDLTESYNSTHCYFTIAAGSQEQGFVLGLPFIQKTYIVVDYTLNQLSLAPINANVTENNITAIGSNGVNGLESTAYNANQGNHTDEDNTGGLSNRGKIEIGVGVALGFVSCTLILGLAYVCFQRKRPRSEPKNQPPEDPGAGTMVSNSHFDKPELAGSNDPGISRINPESMIGKLELAGSEDNQDLDIRSLNSINSRAIHETLPQYGSLKASSSPLHELSG